MTFKLKKPICWITSLAIMLAAVFVPIPRAAAESVTVGDFVVTGGTQGTDYSYSSSTLKVLTNTPLTIANADSSTPTTNKILVNSTTGADITLNGVNIDVSATSGACAFKIDKNCASNVAITIADDSENVLKSGVNCAGLQKFNDNSYSLEIKGGTNGTGKLTAIGGASGAGIGGYSSSKKGGNLIISGGIITATGGSSAAGIGSGANGACSNITISGGTVTATGGSSGAGIGCGFNSSCSNITISGGTVTAQGNGGGAGIGCGKTPSSKDENNLSGIVIKGGSVTASGSVYNGCTAPAIGGGVNNNCDGIPVTPTNGSEKVYLFEVDTRGANSVEINGENFTPIKHGDEDKIYVYLPAKSATAPNTIKINDTTVEKWINIVQIPAEDTTTYVYDGNEKTYTIPESAFYTVSGNVQTDPNTYYVTVSLNDKDNSLWSDDTTDDLKYEFVINKIPVDSFDDINVSYPYTETGWQYVTLPELPDGVKDSLVYTITTRTEEDTNSILSNSRYQTPSTSNGQIKFFLNNNTIDKVNNTAKIKVCVTSDYYADIEYYVIVTLTEKAEQAAPSIDDFTLDFAVDDNNKYTATINTKLTGVEYSFDGTTWSDTNILTNIEHNTEVTAYIRYKETSTGNASPSVMQKASTAHANLTHHDEVEKTCLIDGAIEYWSCDSCGLLFSDKDGKNAISYEDIVVPCTGHDCDYAVWAKNKNGHWHTCNNCGMLDYSAHISGGAATPTTAETCRVCGYVISPATGFAAPPEIAPEVGVYSAPQEVTITCATEGADIYYTTDGTEPTADSTLYTGAFTLSESATVKAIAVKSGMGDSTVTTRMYTIIIADESTEESGELGGDGETSEFGGDGESNESGGDSGSTGGDSGSTGGDSGTTGGDSGSTGGDSGSTGGDSGTTGGDSGTTGGDSGSTDGDDETSESGGDSGSTGGSGGSHVHHHVTIPKEPTINAGAKSGWSAILEQIKQMKSGTLEIEMNNSSLLPKEVIELIKGKDITLVLKSDCTIEINGLNVTIVKNTGVETKINGFTLSEAVAGEITDYIHLQTISVDTIGAFGYTAALSVYVGPAYAGLKANLYAVQGDSVKCIGVCVIDADGTAQLEISAGGEFVLVIDTISRLSGDSNDDCKVDESDAELLLKAAFAVAALDERKKPFCDVDADGKITIIDASLVLKYSANLVEI